MSLTTTITEALTLEGSDCGSSVSITQDDVVYYESKIVRLGAGTTNGVVLYRCSSSGTNDSSGVIFDYDKVKYARITNLDTEEWCSISVETGTQNDSWVQIKIGPGGSFIINDHANWIGEVSGSSQQVVEEVQATADTSTEVDVEVFIGYEE